jgi:hypothetical protein
MSVLAYNIHSYGHKRAVRVGRQSVVKFNATKVEKRLKKIEEGQQPYYPITLVYLSLTSTPFIRCEVLRLAESSVNWKAEA